MEDSVSIKSHVAPVFLDAAEQECQQALYQQRLLYNARWYSSAMFSHGTSLLRLAGIAVSAVGALLCVFYLAYPGSCPTWFYAKYYLVLFVAGMVLFYKLPWIQARVIDRMKTSGAGSCRRQAARMVRQARKLVPFEAEYLIKGDSIACYRDRDINPKPRWSRRLQGYAVLGEYATLLFRKPTSIIPTMLLLHEDSAKIASVFDRIGLPYKKLTGE